MGMFGSGALQNIAMALGNRGFMPGEDQTAQQMAGGYAPVARPQGGGWRDNLMMIGAALKDASSGGSDNMMNLMQLQAMRQKQALMQQAAGLFGGQAQQPQQAPLNPSNPSVADMVQGQMNGDPNAPTAAQTGARMPMPQISQVPQMEQVAPKLARLAAAGIDITPYVNLIEKSQPNLTNINGFAVDSRDAASKGKYFPSLDKGQEPLYDARGNVVGARNMDGTVQAAAQMAGAVSGATEAGKAPYQFQTVQGPDGKSRVISNETAAMLGAHGGIISTGRAPEEQAAAGAIQGAQTGAQVALPQTLAQADNTLSVIQSIKNDPALQMRTGGWAMAPAIPGTPGAAFDAKVAQLKGQLFLQAYSTLRGGGQITEVEGKKATDAMARLNTSQSPEDFKKSLSDLEEVISAGRQRAAATAQGGPSAALPGAMTPPRAAIEAELRRRGLLR